MDRMTAQEMDARDPLRRVRGRFLLPEGRVYLDGNSLGALQPSVQQAAHDVLETWRAHAIGGWNRGWVELAGRTADRLAGVLGAEPDEIAVADSTSTNLFKALVAGLELRPDRHTLLVAGDDFPTDVYVASGVAELTGAQVRTVSADVLDDAIDDDVAVVLRSHVDYRTGRRVDLAEAVGRARTVGAVTVWDLSHSVGALDLQLDEWQADLAVGCSYKYLNGGPGAPAWIYAAKRHHDQLATALRGWFGHVEPFAFSSSYVPAEGARRFENGTPPILSLAALHASLEVFEQVALSEVERKAAELTDLFIRLVDVRCRDLEVVTPRAPSARAAQVSLRHPSARGLIGALSRRGVVGDHRPPDLLRFGFAPLYVGFEDVWEAVDQLADLLDSRDWEQGDADIPAGPVP